MSSPELHAVIEQMRSADVLGLPSVASMREALEAVGAMHPVDADIVSADQRRRRRSVRSLVPT